MRTLSWPVALLAMPPPEAVAETVSSEPAARFPATLTVKVIASLVLALNPVVRVQVSVPVLQVQPEVGVDPTILATVRPAGSTAVRVSDGLVGLVVLVLLTLMVKVSAGSPCTNSAGLLVIETATVGLGSADTTVDRPNKLNASNCSCGLNGPVVHAAGNTSPWSSPSSNTWYSLYKTCPH